MVEGVAELWRADDACGEPSKLLPQGGRGTIREANGGGVTPSNDRGHPSVSRSRDCHLPLQGRSLGALAPDAHRLAAALRDPAATAALSDAGWTELIAIARAEQLIGTLAHRLHGLDLPPRVAGLMAAARASAEQQRQAALWEAEMARRALAPLDVPVVLLKGTAFVAAGLAAGVGRSIGDLDILVPRAALDRVEAALFAAGWEWVKPDPYDDAYYRRWMHELPPLIHKTRDRMIDVHHTILPLTARPTPDAEALIAASVPLENGLRVLSPSDMICHAAAHLLADGDLAGGLRNLWDIHRLVGEFGTEGLAARAAHHGLALPVARALRLARDLFGTEGAEGAAPPLFA
ncbi:MAG: nucleotidyltransferase family protein, partial [Sphingomonas sp.]|nr:nucleotidyltransferase family protein [Sphingomonas sp.]